MSKQNLISINKFRKEYFRAGSAPAPTTVRRWIKEGIIAGKMVVGVGQKDSYYVNAAAWEKSTGDTEVDDFLSTINDSKAA